MPNNSYVWICLFVFVDHGNGLCICKHDLKMNEVNDIETIKKQGDMKIFTNQKMNGLC
jgi:hypothetical protein